MTSKSLIRKLIKYMLSDQSNEWTAGASKERITDPNAINPFV